MKILLVNDQGKTLARLDDVEKFDGTIPGHVAGMLDLLEVLIASAKQAEANSPISRSLTGAADMREIPA